jgi:hypothetical protein
MTLARIRDNVVGDDSWSRCCGSAVRCGSAREAAARDGQGTPSISDIGVQCPACRERVSTCMVLGLDREYMRLGAGGYERFGLQRK